MLGRIFLSIHRQQPTLCECLAVGKLFKTVVSLKNTTFSSGEEYTALHLGCFYGCHSKNVATYFLRRGTFALRNYLSLFFCAANMNHIISACRLCPRCVLLDIASSQFRAMSQQMVTFSTACKHQRGPAAASGWENHL